MCMRNILIPIALLLLGFTLKAQTDSSKITQTGISIICRNQADSVVLRWGPSNHVRWSRLNRYGYKLERFVLEKESKGKIKPEKLGPDTLRPWSLDEWKSRFPKEHPYAPVVVQALYGKTFTTSQFQSDVASIRAKSQEGELRHSFALLMADFDARVADGLALRWVDKNAPKGKRIQYRLISLDPQFPDTALVGINREEALDEIPLPSDMEVEELDLSIKLRWNTHPEAPLFSAWWLERSVDGANWNRLSTIPIVKADAPQALYSEPYVYFTDTLIKQNYVPYQYRIIGITPFAELSVPSKVVTAMGRDRNAPPSPEINDPKDVNGKLKISWKYSNPPSDLKGFYIGKSAIINGPFEKTQEAILPANTREWIDENTDVLGENYYVVYAVDTSGNTSASLPAYGFLRDSIAPGKPMKPSGNIDTNGVVRLHWKLGPEKDILGYRVYFANAIDHEFSILTPKPNQDTTFTDTITLNTLSKKIYYKIVAVDRNYNHSKVSEILTLLKPDILPPVEPLFSNFKVSDNSVDLSFIPSSSKDVQTHEIFRAEAGTSNWVKIHSWKKPEIISTYSDKSVKGGTYYQYTILAIDSSGNKSKRSPTVDVRVIPKVSREALSSPQATFNAEKKSIDLSWKKPVAPVKHYVIYRGKSGKRPSSLTSVEGNLTNFSDTSMTGKGTYRYMIRAIYADGGESPFLNFLEVEVK